MSAVLFVIGIIALVVNIIIGIMTRSFLGFVIFLAGGFVLSMLFFGLAVVIDKQDEILAKLQSQNERLRKPLEKTICARCEKEHDINCSSCPHCALKPG